jgi:hypothetical protein
VFAVLAVAAFSLATDAAAVSVANHDDKEHKLTIIEGDAKQDQVLKPQAVLDNICQKGCIIRLNDSENDEYELDGSEVVSIEDGYLYYDGPDVPASPAPPPAAGDAAKPSHPKSE